jgi:hypothetical protein
MGGVSMTQGLAVLAVVLGVVVGGASARELGECDGVKLYNGATFLGCSSTLRMSSPSFACTRGAAGSVECQVNALTANGANCSAGSFPLGVDASGAAEGCTALSASNAGTATALAANPTDCAANQFATTIAANGNLTCAGLTDADVPNNITVDVATALAANPTDCAANQFATTIAASGNLTCAALTDADVPNSITVDLAAAATALAANPADCAANQFATTIAANGALTCAALTDADIPNTITINTAATASALAANGANCTSGSVAGGVDAAGAAESCIDPVEATETVALTNKTIDGASNDVQTRRHATDCTALTDGVTGEQCYEQDSDRLFVCEPTAGACDTAAEWRFVTPIFDGADITCDAAGLCQLHTDVSMLGQCIGDIGASSEFCATTDFTGRAVDMAAATTLRIPTNTDAESTTEGLLRQNDTLDRLEVGADGARTLRFSSGAPHATVGGQTATATTWTYAGQVSACSSLNSDGTRAICGWGQCTGSEGSGTCELRANHAYLRSSIIPQATGVKQAVVIETSSFSWTAGNITTVTTGADTASLGVPLIIRVRDNATISSSGTISAKGATGSTGGTPLSSTAGRSGGGTGFWFGSTGGTTAGTAGAVGSPQFDVAANNLAFMHPLPFIGGTGGGAAPVTGNAAGTALNPVGMSGPSYGGTGGGGGGCAAGATGTAGAGGMGGGYVRLEVGGKYTCTNATLTASGANGAANSGGGGGGGGVLVLASEIGTDTCTYTAAGGTGGASGGNCGAGGAGGAGVTIRATVPR